jgi:hypothetical protein
LDLELETRVSRLFFVTVKYSAAVAPDLPRQLLVKASKNRPSVNEDDEVVFYRKLAPLVGSPPCVRCFASIERGDSQRGTLVLEDLRYTHDHPPWPVPPSFAHCKLAADALAQVHARLWEAPTLGTTIGRPHTVESLTTMVNEISAHLPRFIDTFGDQLNKETLDIYARVFSSSLQPWMRLTDSHALTIIHGDAHTWNFLFPRSGSGCAFLIDWQLWHVDVGARDLAFLMALHWYPSRRRELEAALVHHYHEALLRNGVENYSFDDLWLDYRRSVVRNLTIPLIFWGRGMKPEGWWHRLECAVDAYRELDCDELL